MNTIFLIRSHFEHLLRNYLTSKKNGKKHQRNFYYEDDNKKKANYIACRCVAFLSLHLFMIRFHLIIMFNVIKPKLLTNIAIDYYVTQHLTVKRKRTKTIFSNMRNLFLAIFVIPFSYYLNSI